MNFYEILELPFSDTTTAEMIKKSYRRLSMIYHPDKNAANNHSDTTAKFQQIAQAYETLGDVSKRKEYDSTSSSSASASASASDLSSPLFANRFTDMMFKAMMTTTTTTTTDESRRPTPIVESVTVSLGKMFTGTCIPVEIQRWDERETIYVTIPPGSDEGEIILLPHRGNSHNQLKGDIKIVLHCHNDTEFQRNGLDLILTKMITLKESLTGFTFTVQHLTGKSYTITNPSGHIIHPGYRKLIPGLGMVRENHVGNLVIVFQIQFPIRLSDTTIQQILALDW